MGIKVKKGEFTSRDGSKKGISGLMNIKCVVSEDPESFLHIGSGRVLLEGLEAVSASMSFEEALRRSQLGVVEEVQEFYKLGGKPTIPGSALKGTCRARLELSVISKEGLVEFGFRQASPKGPIPQKGHHGWRHFRLWEQSVREDREIDCDLTKKSLACRTCDLFGAPGLSSRVYFGNLIADSYELFKLRLDYGESLEAVGPRSSFSGWVYFRDLKPYEVGLILVGLGGSNKGDFVKVLLGRSKYRERQVDFSEPQGLQGKKVRFGVVSFSVKELLLISPREERLKGVELSSRITEWVKEAESEVKGLRIGYSEADKLMEVK